MKFQLLILFSFILAANACCPMKLEVKHSKDCDQCTECIYQNETMKRSMEMWCHSPVCGQNIHNGMTCPITYHGLCGLSRCAKMGVKLYCLSSSANVSWDLSTYLHNIKVDSKIVKTRRAEWFFFHSAKSLLYPLYLSLFK